MPNPDIPPYIRDPTPPLLLPFPPYSSSASSSPRVHTWPCAVTRGPALSADSLRRRRPPHAAGGEMKWGLAAAVASAAAIAAASGAELLACDCDASAPAATVGRCDGLVLSRQQHDDDEESSSASREISHSSGGRRGDRFAPRFDGLRFIETLVTAHR